MKTLRAANSLIRSCAAGPGSVARTVPSSTQAAAILTSAPRCALPRRTDALAARASICCFSQTAPQNKKKEKPQPQSNKTSKTSKTTSDSSDSSDVRPKDPNAPAANPEEPYDLSDLSHTFTTIEHKKTEELLQIQPRFAGDKIGAVRVELDRKTGGSAYPLRELATVAPAGAGGRRWAVLAFEESSVKPIMSAIQKSADFNQQPQRSEDNPLELTLTIEPERPEALAARARDVFHAWADRVRHAARAREKLHKRWRQDNAITADDVVLLGAKVDKLRDEVMRRIEKKQKEMLDSIERSSR
ncbi:ribosome recycling factor domain-containing protein [Echria macrotheca]|uniref:Ribosome recycling factor domain-containing protein n=1 Tax=Echria macrotheca TaxID=438768 RepID=A0AAJ0BFS9_9PEZI|nr:ribosome recycling factor domain-containing protein [Echria macrotheca]